jgi:ADP-ribosylglycohydrolase
MMPAGRSRKDAVQGVIVGAIVGDAFGSVLEGISPSDAEKPVARRADRATPWQYTDDGAMVLAVAEGRQRRPYHAMQRDPLRTQLRSRRAWEVEIRSSANALGNLAAVFSDRQAP